MDERTRLIAGLVGGLFVGGIIGLATGLGFLLGAAIAWGALVAFALLSSGMGSPGDRL